MAVFRDADLVPGRQALNVRREDVARRDGHAHAHDGPGEHLVGAGGARAGDVGEADDEIVYAAERRGGRHDDPACVISSKYFCMSQALVGLCLVLWSLCWLSSSSLIMTRPGLSPSCT